LFFVGVYHPQATTSARAIRILNLMLDITSKHKQSRNKFAVTKENLAYLAGKMFVVCYFMYFSVCYS